MQYTTTLDFLRSREEGQGLLLDLDLGSEAPPVKASPRRRWHGAAFGAAMLISSMLMAACSPPAAVPFEVLMDYRENHTPETYIAWQGCEIVHVVERSRVESDHQTSTVLVADIQCAGDPGEYQWSVLCTTDHPEQADRCRKRVLHDGE